MTVTCGWAEVEIKGPEHPKPRFGDDPTETETELSFWRETEVEIQLPEGALKDQEAPSRAFKPSHALAGRMLRREQHLLLLLPRQRQRQPHDDTSNSQHLGHKSPWILPTTL